MTTPGPSRSAPVVALLGCAAVLYLLAQVGRLVPTESWDLVRPLDGFFTAGNVAVTVLLALWGHLLVDALLEVRPRGVVHVVRRAGEVIAPVVATVSLVCAAAVVVDGVDETDGATWGSTWRSVLQVMSFRLNTWIRTDPGGARGDLTSLWIFSVLVQLAVVILLLVVLLGRRPRILAGVLLLAASACAVGRVVYLADQGWYPVSLATWTRADGFLLGGAAAALARTVSLASRTGTAVLGGATLILGGTVLASSLVTVEETFQVLVPAVAVLAALAAVTASRSLGSGALIGELLGHEALVVLGRHGVLIVAWAPFVAVTVGRHIDLRPVGLAPVVAVAVTAVIVAVSSRALGWVAARLRDAWPAGAVRPRASAEVGGDDRRPRSQPPAHG